ncbi:unnamed protein product [Meloidogyne enterolobii]|uniref:Uncharacterized protein n=1 Tax=Meloidogyne enterolobii TaxID=390850 RepID=A0ACB1AEV0_MELEN
MDTNGVTDKCIDNTMEQEKTTTTTASTQQTQQQQPHKVIVTDDSVEEEKKDDEIIKEKQQQQVVDNIVSVEGGEVCGDNVNNEEGDGENNLEERQNLNNNNSSSTTQIPIISSPPQLNINNLSLSTTSKLRQEHRLKTRWTFWFLNSDRELTWLERLKKVCTIESAEAFWALYDNIRPPSAMQSGCDYNFFKEGIQPVWEVPENKDGGRLIVQIDNKNKIEHLDALWLELLVALIGEQFGRDSEYVCGAVCNMRGKGHKICLWTKNAEAEEANRRIGAILKSRFQDTTNCSIRVNYEEHNVSQHKSSSATQVRFVL